MVSHIPVLLQEVLTYLDPKPGQRFIDATIDGGGHAAAVLEKIEPSGKLLGIEWDNELLKQLELKVKSLKFKSGVVLVNDSYASLKKIAEENNFTNADGILFDLGMSSWHLEEAGRGFSFQRDEPLDMRFGPHKNVSSSKFQIPSSTAEEIVNKWSYDELAKILKEYGGERFAKRIAAVVARERKDNSIKTTFQLVEMIKKAVPFWYRYGHRIHYATRTFQALRIAVNDELGNVQKGLTDALSVLKSGGRMAVISFHSLEDRIIKNFFRDNERAGLIKILTKKPIVPTLREIEENPRARSAKLRVVIKV